MELRESGDALCDEHVTVIVLQDWKHFATDRFESLIGRAEEFQRFLSAMGKTRCLVQQSEFGPFDAAKCEVEVPIHEH